MSSSDQSTPTLCPNCSTFYGSARFENYCSKCYNQLFGSTPPSISSAVTSDSDSSNRTNNTPNASSTPSADLGISSPLRTSQPISIASPKSPASAVSSNPLQVSSSLPGMHFRMDVDSPEPSPSASPSSYGEGGLLRKKRNLCNLDGCKKKLGLTAVECRCGGTFCSTHRYAEQHNCTFDYKGTKQALLKTANPLIAPSKIAEI